jgi:hypothetical protein
MAEYTRYAGPFPVVDHEADVTKDCRSWSASVLCGGVVSLAINRLTWSTRHPLDRDASFVVGMIRVWQLDLVRLEARQISLQTRGSSIESQCSRRPERE